MTVSELEAELAQAIFEANLLTRALSLMGMRVGLDLVERDNLAHPDGYTEILVRSNVTD